MEHKVYLIGGIGDGQGFIVSDEQLQSRSLRARGTPSLTRERCQPPKDIPTETYRIEALFFPSRYGHHDLFIAIPVDERITAFQSVEHVLEYYINRRQT